MRFILRVLLTLACGTAVLSAAPVDRVVPSSTTRDRHGDRLPKDVVGRLGTVRFRGILQRGPEGKSLATLRGNRATLVDPDTGAELKPLPGPDPAAFEADHFLISPDGRLIAYGGADGVEVWETTGRLRHKLHIDTEIPSSVAARPVVYLPNAAALIVDQANNDCAVSCWDLSTGERRWSHLQQERDPEASCRTVGLGPDNTILLLSSEQRQDTSGLLLAADTGHVKHTIHLGADVNADDIVIAPNGRMLLVTHTTGEIHRLELPSGRDLGKMGSIANHTGTVAAFSPDGKRIAVSSGDRVRVFNAETGQEMTKSIGINAFVDLPPMIMLNTINTSNLDSAIVFTADDAAIWAVLPNDPVWRRYNAATGREKKLPDHGHRARIQSVAASVDGQRIITAGFRESVCIWNPATGELIRRLGGSSTPSFFGSMGTLDTMALAPDGKTVAVKTEMDRLQLWDTTTGRVRRSIKLPDDTSSGIAYSPDGKSIAVSPGSNGNNETSFVRIYDASTGKESRKFASAGTQSNMIAYSPNGRWLAVGLGNPDGQDSIHVLDAATGRTLRTFDGAIAGCAFLPLGDILCFSTHDEITLAELSSGGCRLKLAVPTGDTVDLLAISPDGRWLAGANNGAGTRKIHLWDLRTGTLLPPLIGHDGCITALAFAPDGRLISGSSDTTALIWEMSRAAPSVEAFHHPEEWSAAWTALAGDAGPAHIAIERLLATGTPAIAWLRHHLKPAAPIDAARIHQLLERLNADRFADRQKASAELERFDRQAEPFLRKHLEGKLSAEARRRTVRLLDHLDNPSSDPERLRETRALELLQRMNNDAAQAMLGELANGDPAARLTQLSREIPRTAVIENAGAATQSK